MDNKSKLIELLHNKLIRSDNVPLYMCQHPGK